MFNNFLDYIKSIQEKIGNNALVDIHILKDKNIYIRIEWENIKPRLDTVIEPNEDINERIESLIEYAKYCYSYFKDEKVVELEYIDWLKNQKENKND